MQKQPLYLQILQVIETNPSWVMIEDIVKTIFPGVYAHASEKVRKRFYQKVLNNIGHVHRAAREQGVEIAIRYFDGKAAYMVDTDASELVTYDEITRLRQRIWELKNELEDCKGEQEDIEATNELINMNQPLIFEVAD